MDDVRKELLQSILEKFGTVTRIIHSNQCVRFGEYTLSQLQIRTLFNIAKKQKPLAIKDLVKLLGVTPGAVTQLVDGLVSMNLVKREEDINDRRVILIALTQHAEDELDNLKQEYLASASQVFETLNDEEINELIMLLDKVNTPKAQPAQ